MCASLSVHHFEKALGIVSGIFEERGGATDGVLAYGVDGHLLSVPTAAHFVAGVEVVEAVVVAMHGASVAQDSAQEGDVEGEKKEDEKGNDAVCNVDVHVQLLSRAYPKNGGVNLLLFCFRGAKVGIFREKASMKDTKSESLS